MKKNCCKRGFALFLAAVMAFGTLQTTAFATSGETETSTETVEKNVQINVKDPADRDQTTNATVTTESSELDVTLKVTTDLDKPKTTTTTTEDSTTTTETTTVTGNTSVNVMEKNEKDEDIVGNTPIKVKTEVDEDGDVKFTVTDGEDNEIEPGTEGGGVDLTGSDTDFEKAVENFQLEDKEHGTTQTVRADGAIVTNKGNITTVYYPGDGATETYEVNDNVVKVTKVAKSKDNPDVTVITTTTTVTTEDGTVETETTEANGTTVTTVTTTDKDGNKTTKKFSETSESAQRVDGNGVTVTNTGDATIIEKGGQSIIKFNSGKTITKDGNKILAVEADGSKVLQVTTEDGKVISTSEDADGARSQMVEENGVKAITSISSDGNTVSQELADGTRVTYRKEDGAWTKLTMVNGVIASEAVTVDAAEVPTIAPIEEFTVELTYDESLDSLKHETHIGALEGSNKLADGELPTPNKAVQTTRTEENEGKKTTTTVTTKTSEIVKPDGSDDAALQVVVTVETVTVTAEKLNDKELQETLGEAAYKTFVEDVKKALEQGGELGSYLYTAEDGSIYVVTKIVKTTTTQKDGETTETKTEEREPFSDFTYSTDDLLGDIKNFAVFAKEYTVNSDMEGNIAVGTLHFNGGNVGVDQSKLQGEFGDGYKSDGNNFTSTSYKDNDTVSYIGTIASSGEVRFHTTGAALVVGSQNAVSSDGQNYFLTDENGHTVKLTDGNSKISDVYVATKETEIDFDKAFEQLEKYATKLAGTSANAQINQTGGDSNNPQYTISGTETETGVYVVSVDISCFNNNSGFINVTLPENSQLVINVTGLVDGESYSLNRQLQMNGQTIGQWDSAASNIMFNFGTYAGTLDFGETSKGVILAPKATVQINTTHDGSVIAEKVSNTNGEIHKTLSWDEPKPSEDPRESDDGVYKLEAVKLNAEAHKVSETIKVIPDPPLPPEAPTSFTFEIPKYAAGPFSADPVTPPSDPPEDPTPPPSEPPEEPTPPPPPEEPPEEPPVPPEEIPDEEVPLTEAPPEEEEIPDDDVPLADVPATGDISVMWYAVTLLSVSGLAVLAVLKKGNRYNSKVR